MGGTGAFVFFVAMVVIIYIVFRKKKSSKQITDVIQNPYYTNDLENEPSSSKCAETVVAVRNPYYEE